MTSQTDHDDGFVDLYGHQLMRRRRGLVLAIAATIADDGPIPWRTLIDAYSDGTTNTDWHDKNFTANPIARPRRTIENILYELSAYGAIERIGHRGGRQRLDTRALRITTLGRQWLTEQQKGPTP